MSPTRREIREDFVAGKEEILSIFSPYLWSLWKMKNYSNEWKLYDPYDWQGKWYICIVLICRSIVIWLCQIWWKFAHVQTEPILMDKGTYEIPAFFYGTIMQIIEVRTCVNLAMTL